MKQTFDRENGHGRFLRFVDKWSFVMVVGICALTIAGAAVWSGTANKEDTASLTEAQAAMEETHPTAQATLSPIPSAKPEVKTETVTESEAAKAQREAEEKERSEQAAADTEPIGEVPVMAEQTPKAAEEKKSNEEQPILAVPLEGKTVRAYAKDELLYSETLRQWMTHPGIDVAAAAGTPVCAAADGTVTAVTEDALLGYTVIVDHGEGLSTVYASLSKEGRPGQGAKLRAGDPVGLCDVTAQSESALGAHLHFEVRRDGENIDPNGFFPEGKQE